ncbi:MAG: dihydrolipoyl dehydrogenase [Firmicutes bacterium]|nr:dihydrolipoyl dehydrogenase [Bacillota bacterium]
MSEKRDLLIIGAGPGGYVAAIYAAKKGYKVTLVDKSYIGGTCLNIGCIPTKSLIHSASLYHEAISNEEFGLNVSDARIDLEKAVSKKEEIRKTLIDGIVFLLNKYNVEIIFGTAKLTGNHTASITTETKNLEIEASNIIISTGSKTKHLPLEGFDLPGVMDSEALLDNKKLPRSLTVIGGGIIGMEFAFMYGMMGVNVNVVEFLPNILPLIDRDVSLRLIRFAKQNNISIQTSSQVTKIEKLDDGTLRTHFILKGNQNYVDSDLVLEAVGRVPVIEGIGLENTDIVFEKKGIVVDSSMKTNLENVYAIGDVTGIMQLAHVASHQAIIAVDNMMGNQAKMEYDYIPSVVFTSPQIASVGKMESVLKDEEASYRVFKVPFSANGRAVLMNQSFGFIKMLIDNQSNKLLGATVFGGDAEHLVSQLTIMMKNHLTFEEIKETVFSHPTTSELIHEGALGVLKEAIHFVD